MASQFDVRIFGCVQNQLLSIYRLSAQCSKTGPFRVRLTKKLVMVIVTDSSLMENHRLKTLSVFVSDMRSWLLGESVKP